jgi:hypothetical protein
MATQPLDRMVVHLAPSKMPRGDYPRDWREEKIIEEEHIMWM